MRVKASTAMNKNAANPTLERVNLCKDTSDQEILKTDFFTEMNGQAVTRLRSKQIGMFNWCASHVAPMQNLGS
jgi:hypothetical protein